MTKKPYHLMKKRQLYAIYHSTRQRAGEAKGTYWVPSLKHQLVSWLEKHYQPKFKPQPTPDKQLQFWFDTSEGRSSK